MLHMHQMSDRSVMEQFIAMEGDVQKPGRRPPLKETPSVKSPNNLIKTLYSKTHCEMPSHRKKKKKGSK